MAPVTLSQSPGELSIDDRSLDYSSASRSPLLKQIRKIAPLGINVLLQGETGTGKSSSAKAIHNLSPRRDQKFLVINCGSLYGALIESEMFGHVRGAFTSADRDHKGKFTEAGRGTILLDEVDSLPIEIQAKLCAHCRRAGIRTGWIQSDRPDASAIDCREQSAARTGGGGRTIPFRFVLSTQRRDVSPSRFAQRKRDHPQLGRPFYRRVLPAIKFSRVRH
ncbi:MAG: sigma 54-interacting transcriptional regulator [Hyphomicrobium sp.]